MSDPSDRDLPQRGGGFSLKPLDVLRWLLLVAVVAAVVVALVRNWTAVSQQLSVIGWRRIALAAIPALASPVFAMFCWRALMTGLGSTVPWPAAGGIFFVGQLGKYLPGSVWTVVAQTEMARRLGVPRRNTALAGVIFIAIVIVVGALFGLPALPTLLGASSSAPWWLVAVALLIGLAVLNPPVLDRALRWGLRLVRQPVPERRLPARTIWVSAAWALAAWFVMALSMLILSLPFNEVSLWRLAVIAGCGFSLSGVIGMVALFAPAGVGVRDGLFVLLLATVIPLPAAGAVVVISRFLTVVSDVIVALAGFGYARTHHLLGRAGQTAAGDVSR